MPEPPRPAALFAVAGVVCAALLTYAGSRPVRPQPQPPPKWGADLSGFYHCDGQSRGGTPYEGQVSIRRHNELYLISWQVGTSQSVGVGMRHGDTLSVGWLTDSELREKDFTRGVTVFKINVQKRTLEGRYLAVPGNGVSAEETLTFTRPLRQPPKKDDV